MVAEWLWRVCKASMGKGKAAGDHQKAVIFILYHYTRVVR